MTTLALPETRYKPGRGALLFIGAMWVGILACVAIVVATNSASVAIVALVGIPVTVLAVTSLTKSHRDPVAFFTMLLTCAFIIPAKLSFTPLGGSATPALLLGLVAVLIWLCTRLVPTLPFDHHRQPVRIAVLIFGWTSLAAWVAAYARGATSLELRAANRGLLVLLGAIGICLLAVDGITDRDRLITLLHRLVGFGAILASFGIVQFVTGFDPASHIKVPGLGVVVEGTIQIGTRSDFRRVAGTTLHPIEFGVVLAMIFPIALHFALDGPTKKIRFWNRVALLLMAMALPMSLSRSAFIGLAATAIVLVPSWKWRRQINMLAITLFGLVAMRVAFPGLIGTIRSLFTSIFVDTSITHRNTYAASAGSFIRQAPLFGRGLHTYLPQLFSTFDNQYLLSLVETGIIGTLALLGFWLAGFFSARGAVRRSTDPQHKGLAAAVSAACLVPLFTSATFDFLSFPVATAVAFFIVGVAGALWRFERYGPSDESEVDLSETTNVPERV